MSTFPKLTTILVFVEQGFWRMPLFTEWIGASSCEAILAVPFTLRQRFPEPWKKDSTSLTQCWSTDLCPACGSLHASMCWNTRNTEWESTYFSLLRQQWRSQPSQVSRVEHFKRIHLGGEIVDVFFVKTACSRSWSRCARCWLRWETWICNLWEEWLFSQSAKA